MLALSEPGRLLFPLVRAGFDRLAQGTDLLRRARMTDDLRVQVYVTVAVRWLIPRLHRFQGANPNLLVRINTSVLDWEFNQDIADLGLICTPSPDRPGLHYDLLFEALLFPVCTPAVAQSAVSLGLFAMGLSAGLQALPRGPVGSGYLAPPVLSAIYLPPSLVAVAAGGLPLVFGMTIVAGLFEALLSRLLPKLRLAFPPLVCGFIVAAVGIACSAAHAQR